VSPGIPVRRNIFNWNTSKSGQLEAKVKRLLRHPHVLRLAQGLHPFAEKEEELQKDHSSATPGDRSGPRRRSGFSRQNEPAALSGSTQEAANFTMIKAAELLFKAPEANKRPSCS